jgi:hypothetical protein
MRIVLFIVLSIGAAVFTGTEPALSQMVPAGVIEGRVVNAETGEPLQGAHVFLSGTKIGTVTNSSGRYRLQRVPAGTHRLIVSIIGFGRTGTGLTLSPGESKTAHAKLSPVIYELGEIYAGNLDDRWERHLEKFTELFIGESSFADSVKILNPEVLRFETRWWGRFTAEALAPLQIENRALGYHVTYYLDEFYHSGLRTRWDGDPLFAEMTPDSEEQARYWEQNRTKAFYGSLRHFLIALVEGRIERDGFVIFNLRRETYGFSARNKFRASADRLIRDTDEDYLFNMRFPGRLEIVYTEAPEDREYVRWARDIRRGPASVQTSYMELNERYITIDPDGEVQEVYGATRFGYFAYHRFADKTPREYRPEGFD